MTAKARRAIAVIRRCVRADRFSVTVHFSRRMGQRGLFWPDVQVVIDHPGVVRPGGVDEFGRPKWIIGGHAAIGGNREIVCAIEIDESGTEFLTLYWES